MTNATGITIKVPDGWWLKHLIQINQIGYEIQYWSQEEYVYGFGSTIDEAITDAMLRIESEDTFSRLFVQTKTPMVSLESLGLAKPMKRRSLNAT